MREEVRAGEYDAVEHVGGFFLGGRPNDGCGADLPLSRHLRGAMLRPPCKRTLQGMGSKGNSQVEVITQKPRAARPDNWANDLALLEVLDVM